jgi:hypothetical protein
MIDVLNYLGEGKILQDEKKGFPIICSMFKNKVQILCQSCSAFCGRLEKSRSFLDMVHIILITFEK